MRLKYFAPILATIYLVSSVLADTVTTKNGSVLNGTITLIDEGVIHIETSYAGKLQLKQENVASFESDTPLNLRLNDGTTLSGTVAAKNKNTLSIKNETGTEKILADQIVTGWTPDKIDPEVERNQRKWKNNFAVDLNGKTGNVEQYNFGLELNFRLKGPNDEAYFGFDYEEGEQDGNKTADRIVGQASYERFSKDALGWFARTILEQNGITGIDVRSTTSYGASYRLINSDAQSLVIRGGLGYRYTEFEGDDLDNESTVTIEPGLTHTYKYKEWLYLENDINYSPAIDDFNNYNLIHDSSIRLPIGNSKSFWVRMGVRNEYQSQTSADENLDTNYYSQFVYSWK